MITGQQKTMYRQMTLFDKRFNVKLLNRNKTKLEYLHNKSEVR